MPDEIKGNNAVSASPDADSLFYLLKITGRAEIGNRDSDGTVKEFFDEDDIGVIQSTALLQDFNTDEFIEIPGSTNDKWLNGDSSTNPPWGGLNGGQLTITALGIPMSASWSVGATDRETELNAVNAIKAAYESPVPGFGVPFSDQQAWPFWGTQLRDALSTSHNDFLLANNAAQLVAVFQGIIDGKSYVSFPGSNFKFVNSQSSNVIDALNKMYAPTLDGQKSVVDGISTLKDFFTVESFVETQINRTQNIFGPVFSSDTFWNEYQSLTNTTNLTSGVAQNFLLIQQITGQLSTGLSFTGLMDTPTGFESGKFLVANETGLEWTGISFTGLPDTPTGYDDGKILQSTADGLEWVDMPAGGGGGSSSSNYEFCKLTVNSTQFSQADTHRWLSFDGDPADGSANWKFLDTTTNTWGVKPDKAGLYNIDAAYKIVGGSHVSATSEIQIRIYKTNINTGAQTFIGYGTEFFDTAGGWNGPKVEADVQNIYLTDEEVVTVRTWAWRGVNVTTNHEIEKPIRFTYLNVSRADVGGGSSEGGGSSNYEFCKAHIDSNVRLVDSAVQSSVNVNVDPNNLTQGSQDWTHDAGNGIIGLRPPEDGHYNIEGFIQNLGTAALNPSWATVRTKRCFIQKLDISTNTFNSISERTETKDSGNDGILTVEFNEPNIFLTTNDVIFVRTQLNSSTTNAGQFPVSPGAFISLTKAESGGGGGDSGSREFCRAQVSSNSSIGHSTADVDLDISQLATDSKNWTHTDVNRNTVGILVPEDGLYDVSFNIKPLSTDLTWRDNISFLSTALHVIKADGTDVLIQETRNGKSTTNGTLLNNHLYLDNLSLDQGDFLYLRCRVFSSNTSLSWAVDDRFSFLSMSKPGGGSSSDGGNSSTNYEFCKAFAVAGQTFSHQPNGHTKVNLDTNNLTQGSQDWLHTDTTLNVVGIKIPEDGLYNINTNLNPSRDPFTRWQQDVLNFIGKLNVLKANGTTELLGHSQEAKTEINTQNNGALLTVDFSLDNVDLQQGDFIYMETSAWLVQNLTQQHGIDENLSYISVSKSSGGSSSGGGGGSSSSTDIVFESDIASMVGTVSSFVNVPHVPTTDTYTAWDSSNNVWVAPKSMTVLVNCSHKAQNDHQHFYGRIKVGNILKAEQGSTKSSNNTNDSSINLSAVLELQAGDEVSSQVNVQGAGASNNLNQQIMTITELGGGSSSSGGGGDAGTSTGGRGNLDVLKNNLENFQHTLPDSIVVPWFGGGYEGTFDLAFVRPASADTTATNGSNWDIYYTCGRGHTDGELMFTDDADGTLVQANAAINQTSGGDFEVGTLTLKWLIDNGRAFYAGGTSDSGGGSSSVFSKMPFLSTDRVGHGNSNLTPDSSSLATGAENWIYHDTTNNLHGLRPTSNGYYNIDVCVTVNSHDGDVTSWGANVSYAHLMILKRNIDDLTTSTVIARDRENKGYDQGGNIVTRVNESYVYLTTKDVIYVRHNMWAKPAGQSHTWGIDRATSYISLSSSAAGGGGGGNSSTSSGGIGDNKEVISASNFGSKMPDVILLHPINEQNDPRSYRFFGIDQGSDVILYRINSSDKQIAFKNNSAGDFDATFTNTGHVRYTGDTTLQSIIDNGHAVYLGGDSSSSGGGNVVSAIIEGDGTVTSSSDDWIDSVVTNVADGVMTIKFVPNYFTKAPSISTSIEHQDLVAHMSIEHNNLSKDEVQIVQRGTHDASHRSLSQFTIMAQHQDGSGGGGGGGSTILPSGSILQKVTESFPDIANLQTVGTTIAEFDFTPKAVGSIVELEFTASHHENLQSQQQGRFKVDGNFIGDKWYIFHGATNPGSTNTNSWGANTRNTISLRATYTATTTATQKIVMELILDNLDSANLESIVMSAEEIAQSDYVLAGGGNSSTGNGGIGSDPGVIAKSNFSELLPDRINVPLTRANGIQERYFTFEGFWEQDINGVLTSVVQYEWNIGGNGRFRINFINDSNGTFVEYKEQNDSENTDVDFSKIPSAITNQPTLKEFIDANRAIYLGGGGGDSTGGGFIHAVFDGNANIVSKSSEWDTYVNNITFPQGSWNGYAQVNYKNSFTKLPTVLTTAGHVTPNHFFSQVHDQQLTHTAIITSIRGGSAGSSQQAAPFSVTIFSDEIAGGSGGSSGGGGGGGGSSTFEDLTDTPNSFIGESGKFVKVNDTEDALEFTTLNVNDALGLQEVDGEDNCSEFHLQSDKTTNSSAFEDSSVNNYSILGSNVIHSTSNPKAGFGSSSIQFNGNGQLLVADGSAFKFFHTKIIKNYTIQLWIFKDALNTREPLLLTAANNNEHGIRLIVDSDNKVKFDVMKGLSNATGLSLASTSTISAQTWHHVAIVNENNTMSLYLDGNQEHSLAWTSDASTVTPNFGLSIGAGPMGAGQAMVFFNGDMQDIRVDKIAFRSDLLPPTSLLNATCDPSAGKSNIDFKMLRDTPVNYSNAGGKYVKVKDGEDGVEFVEISVGSSTTNEFSTAYVTQDQTSDGFITDLEFGNLVVGRTYRISSTICFESNDASALSRADFYNGTQRIVSLYNKGLTSTVSNSMLFVASDSSISVSGNGLTSNNFIHGLPELSFVQLELPPSVVVEIEDIPVAPVAPPGGGIFSVNDVKMHAGIIDYQDSSNTFSDLSAFDGNIIDISDIRLISKIDNTDDQKTFEDLDSRLTSIDKLDLADVRVIAQIDHTGHSRTFEDFDSSLTSFGVLSFADMIINTKIYSTGTDSVMTTDPYTSHDHSFSWTGIN
jgi:hypothetical protein